jgi:phosphotriesterase-related protein
VATLFTTLGPKQADDVGIILPHEHLFVDLGPVEDASYLHADTDEAVAVMAPEVEKIKAQGVTALVECTPVGVGRRADIDLAISRATNFPVVLPTGIYREPWVPQWVRDSDEDALVEWMVQELEQGIEDANVRAAWIKVGSTDDGVTAQERKILRAAARAGRQTGAVIGSHTVRGVVAREQVTIVEEAGYSASRFIWIHTQAEPDVALHLEMARRGVWVEYDGIGARPDEWFVSAVQRLLDAGFGKQLLLSQDRGWYDPSKPGGGDVQPFTHLLDEFLPKLRAAGCDEGTIGQLLQHNPFAAYAR